MKPIPLLSRCREIHVVRKPVTRESDSIKRVREGFSEEVVLDQRPEGGIEGIRQQGEEGTFQAEGIAGAKLVEKGFQEGTVRSQLTLITAEEDPGSL